MSNNEKILLIKHLPPEIYDDECTSFFKSLGAVSVNYMGRSGFRKNCVFAEFPSHEHALNVIHVLHQRLFFGKRLSVEFTGSYLTTCNDDSDNCKSGTNKTSKKVNDDDEQIDYSKFNAFSPCWDSDYPVPPNMYYKYPAPNTNILTNVVRSLVSCSAFYTQCLHLMNRLHLPPPFDDSERYPGDYVVLRKSDVCISNTNDNSVITKLTDEMELSSSSESELDSGKNECTLKKIVKKPLQHIHNFEPVKKPTKSTESVSNLFETHELSEKSILQFNVDLDSVNKLCKETGVKADDNQEYSGFGLINPIIQQPIQAEEITVDSSSSISSHVMEFQLRKEKPDNMNDDTYHQSIGNNCFEYDRKATQSGPKTVQTLSVNELLSGCLRCADRKNYKVFSKGYDPGLVTSRLYIKNLASSVCEQDLFEIFGVFAMGPVENIDWKPYICADSIDSFSIRLLTEGRMKGQAFIAFKCESTAKQALESTNGYMLHDRPMVVQFARGAKVKQTNET